MNAFLGAHIRELEEEVKLLKNLSHPNIVRYLGIVREEETLNILLEFVPGGSISSLLGKFGPFPEAVIRKYTKQLLLGLEYLHNNGIMHRDIKGANILVDNKGNIKLADFGASKQVVELATVTGAKSMKGTPYWMAPEVILQTGHSFSADIWSVGCTVIEMATGKPPWSQQYQEVAALFYVGKTKSHPPIPEHLSSEAKDFLLKCLQKEPELRQVASELLKHPFVTGESQDSNPVLHAPTVDNSEIPSPITNNEELEVSRCHDTADICNLGSLNCSNAFVEKFSESKNWRLNCSEDDMCLIDKDDSMVSKVRLCSASMLDNVNQSSDPSCEGPEMVPVGFPTTCGEEGNDFSYTGGPSFSEDDDELTESKIRVFLDEKALELKKLQTPLYEEFYNSLNLSCSPSFVEKRDETPPNYLKLPPKSRSPSRAPVGTPSSTADAISTGSPGSNNSRCLSNVDNASEQTPQENSSPRHGDWKGLLVDGHAEPTSPRQRKWKEELDQELERKREMLRQAGLGGKTSSPKDRALNKQRDRTRFASPGK
ncbi:hypothetical protein V6N12_035014 [Hibiscus sabdariffa]|uniref:Protein kinase domain-containing protein n=1 Tax=Hibiscus sabdariffa TaxID=183260 RepID=A0ABR2BPJ5_9ROSI